MKKQHPSIGKYYALPSMGAEGELYKTEKEALKNEEVEDGDTIFILKVVAVKKAKSPKIEIEFVDA